uniref:DUF19 domain-containing protein n=1 Tax=Setaria digitata TaxID=48799 RepID=A0A915PUB6_9BILA
MFSAIQYYAILAIVGHLNSVAANDKGIDLYKGQLMSDSKKCTAFAEQSVSKCLQQKINSFKILMTGGSMQPEAVGEESCSLQLILEFVFFQPVLDYAGKLQENAGAMQLPMQGTNIFRELCDVYAHFKECTEDISCSSISVEAVDASYGYMCGAGYKLFEHHATCFAEVEVENNYVKCRNEASAAITKAQKSKIPNDYNHYFELLCKIMDSYLRCCHPVINRYCGSDAWELVRTVTLDSLRVTMPTCDLHNALL